MFDHELERVRKYKLPKFLNRDFIGIISLKLNTDYAGEVNKRIITFKSFTYFRFRSLTSLSAKTQTFAVVSCGSPLYMSLPSVMMVP